MLASLTSALPSSFVLVGDTLVSNLNEWAIFGFCVEPTSGDSDCFVTMFVMPTFAPHETAIDLTIGNRLRSHANNTDRWSMTSPEQLGELCNLAVDCAREMASQGSNAQIYLRRNLRDFSASRNLHLVEVALLSVLLLGSSEGNVDAIRRNMESLVENKISRQRQTLERVDSYLLKPRTELLNMLEYRRKTFFNIYYPQLANA